MQWYFTVVAPHEVCCQRIATVFNYYKKSINIGRAVLKSELAKEGKGADWQKHSFGSVRHLTEASRKLVPAIS